MNKITPPQSPEYCRAIAEASYISDIGEATEFLHQQFPDAKVLEEASVRGWRFILVKNKDQHDQDQ